MPRVKRKTKESPEQVKVNRSKELKELIGKLHGLAGLRGYDTSSILNKVKTLNPLGEEFETLEEAIRAKGLLMLDGETRIKVPITKRAKITGTPLWKGSLLKEYENDQKGTGIVSSFITFLYPDEEGEEKTEDTEPPIEETPSNQPEDDQPDNADDPDYGVPPQA